jgi:hypothetical protein
MSSPTVNVTGSKGPGNTIAFDLEVGGRAVNVLVYWESDELDGLTEMRRAWMARGTTVNDEERAAIDAWFHATGLDRELPVARA